MNHMRLGAAAAIIATAVLVIFVLSVPHTRDIANIQKETVQPVTPSVSLHDSFKKGLHTITGSIEVPNACTTVAASAALLNASSSAESIQVIITMPVDTGICLQMPSSLSFRTTVAAPEHLPLTATVNGVVASTTVAP